VESPQRRARTWNGKPDRSALQRPVTPKKKKPHLNPLQRRGLENHGAYSLSLERVGVRQFYAGKRSMIKDQYDYFILPKKISFAINKENQP